MTKTVLEIHNNELLDGASNGHLRIVKGLLSESKNKIDINTTDVAGRTPIILASQNGHSTTVRALIEKGADINKQDAATNSALAIAFIRGYDEIVNLLLEQKEIEIPTVITKDKKKVQELLQQVIHHNNIVCAQKLLETLPNNFNHQQINGAYPLTASLGIAIKKGHIGIVDLLLKRIDIAPSLSGSLLTSAAAKGHLEISKNLVNRGVNVNATDELGRTPLMLSVVNGHHRTAGALLAKGANINKQDAASNSPLNFAALKGDLEMVRLLLQHKADPTLKTGGATALMLASAHGKREVVKLLLANKVGLNEKDLNGKTALMLAQESGHKNIVWDLRLAGWQNKITDFFKKDSPAAKQPSEAPLIETEIKKSDLLVKLKLYISRSKPSKKPERSRYL